jgi:hypothetical protein
MVELMTAIFVVSVGVLGTVSALWYGIRSERYSERRTHAVFQAREMLNLIRARNLPFQNGNLAPGSPLNDGDYEDDTDDASFKRPFDAPPFSNDFDNEFNFKRHVEMKLLSTDPGNHLSQVAGLKVTLFWTEGSSEKELTLWAYHRQP